MRFADKVEFIFNIDTIDRTLKDFVSTGSCLATIYKQMLFGMG